jgi:hypothetical protein
MVVLTRACRSPREIRRENLANRDNAVISSTDESPGEGPSRRRLARRNDMSRGFTTEGPDTGILLTQRMVTSPEPTEIMTDFWAAAYAAIGA